MPLRRLTIRYLSTCSLLLTSVSLSTPAPAAIQSATEICPETADPCVITQPFVLADDAILDFGSRTVRIAPGGQLDTGDGTVTLKCGNFISETGTAVGLKVRGPNGFGEIDGGVLRIETTRTCAADSTLHCVGDSECDFGTCAASVCELDRVRPCGDDAACDLGTCSVALCTGDDDRQCADDAACNVGPCNALTRRCVNDSSVVCFSNNQCNFGTCGLDDLRCSADTTAQCGTDADCQRGTCSIDVCTTQDANGYRECSVDSDCTPGPCSAGQGAIRLEGRSRADGFYAGAIVLHAVGDVEIGETIQLQGTALESDGGALEIESRAGAVHIGAAIDARGGGSAYGGEIFVEGATDVTLDAPIHMSAGTYGAGYLELLAGRDLRISDTVFANGTADGASGGDVEAYAGRDLVLDDEAHILSNAHMGVTQAGGWGGVHSFDARRNMTIAAGATVEADGAAPDGVAGDLYVSSTGNLTLAGRIAARSAGADGLPGLLDLRAGGLLRATPASAIVMGGSGGGLGTVSIEGASDVHLDGLIDVRVPSDVSPGNVWVRADGDLAMTGDILVSGDERVPRLDDVELEACRIQLDRGAVIENTAGDSGNTLIAHDRIEIAAGASVTASATGGNLFRYRDAGAPPIVSGFVSPVYQADVRPLLTPCPICGNDVRERGESCDDGNLVDGDGCTSDCQDEGCVAATPGYPAIPLCADGDPCTVDHCDPESHACVSVFGCDDGNACTIDSCDPIDGCSSAAAPLPEASCLAAGRSSIQLKSGLDPSNNELRWRWGRGDAFDHASLGAPDASTTYALCVYDMTGSTPALAASIDVAPSALWEATPPRGWEYADTRAESDGVRKLRLAAGADRQTKASVGARGAHLPLAPAISAAEYFDVDPRVVAQLISSDGMCLTSEFAASHVQRNDGARFRAKAQ